MLIDLNKLFLAAAADKDIFLEPAMSNRHGLVAGATGTGKTVTLQSLAESFSALGVPVFLTDVKGDLAGLSQPGTPEGSVASRIERLGLREKGYLNRGFPVCFWDVFGHQGHPLRTTVSAMGPLLFSRLLNLNDVQSGVMRLIFRIADDQGLLLLDLKDLRRMVAFVGENSGDYKNDYGHVAGASVGAIQRGLLRLEEEGGGVFFGEPALRLEDLFLTDLAGRGQINILAADKLINSPRLYAASLLWLLSELFERLPELGDPPKPRLILMFDEAHLIFSEISGILLTKMDQASRLIRSKGVGIFFISQNPADVPPTILAQLANRVQHALRAYTPQDLKGVRAAAQTFRPNPAFKTEEAITSLSIGEALVSFLDSKGTPEPVERALIVPPESRVGTITAAEREAVIKNSRLWGRYDTPIDRESAYELLEEYFNARQADAYAERQARPEAKQEREERRRLPETTRKDKGDSDILGSIIKEAAKQTSRTISNTIGREVGRKIIRGMLGGLFGGKK